MSIIQAETLLDASPVSSRPRLDARLLRSIPAAENNYPSPMGSFVALSNLPPLSLRPFFTNFFKRPVPLYGTRKRFRAVITPYRFFHFYLFWDCSPRWH